MSNRNSDILRESGDKCISIYEVETADEFQHHHIDLKRFLIVFLYIFFLFPIVLFNFCAWKSLILWKLASLCVLTLGTFICFDIIPISYGVYSLLSYLCVLYARTFGYISMHDPDKIDIRFTSVLAFCWRTIEKKIDDDDGNNGVKVQDSSPLRQKLVQDDTKDNYSFNSKLWYTKGYNKKGYFYNERWAFSIICYSISIAFPVNKIYFNPPSSTSYTQNEKIFFPVTLVSMLFIAAVGLWKLNDTYHYFMSSISPGLIYFTDFFKKLDKETCLSGVAHMKKAVKPIKFFKEHLYGLEILQSVATLYVIAIYIFTAYFSVPYISNYLGSGHSDFTTDNGLYQLGALSLLIMNFNSIMLKLSLTLQMMVMKRELYEKINELKENIDILAQFPKEIIDWQGKYFEKDPSQLLKPKRGLNQKFPGAENWVAAILEDINSEREKNDPDDDSSKKDNSSARQKKLRLKFAKGVSETKLRLDLFKKELDTLAEDITYRFFGLFKIPMERIQAYIIGYASMILGALYSYLLTHRDD